MGEGGVEEDVALEGLVGFGVRLSSDQPIRNLRCKQ